MLKQIIEEIQNVNETVKDKNGAPVKVGDVVLWKGDELYKGKVLKIDTARELLTVDTKTQEGERIGKMQVFADDVQTEESFAKKAKSNDDIFAKMRAMQN